MHPESLDFADPPEAPGCDREERPGKARHLRVASPTVEARALTTIDYAAVIVVGALIVSIAGLGFINSFASVQRAAEPSMGDLSYTVPIAIDLGVLAFTALDVLLARLDMRLTWLRAIPWSLTGVTIYLNVVDQTTWFDRVVHTVLPMLWVVGVEVSAWIVKRRAGLESGRVMDSIRMSRWALSPWRTFLLRRRMILWEIRSYPLALERERERILALTELQDEYGRFAWRWKAPRKIRALHRLGELTPTRIQVDEAEADEVIESEPVSLEPVPEVQGKSSQVDVSDLLPVGQAVAEELVQQGQDLTRDSLAAGLRAAGLSASNQRIGALLSALRAMAAAD